MRFSSKLYTLYALILVHLLHIAGFSICNYFFIFWKTQGRKPDLDMAKIWADIWYFLLGIRHENIFESTYDPCGKLYFPANHSSYMDIPCLFKAIRKQPFRVLGKGRDQKNSCIWFYL